MITRFYYSLTIPKTGVLHQNTKNEFDMTLEKEVPLPEPLPPQMVFDRYAPINQEQGIFWLINELSDETVGEDTDITKELLKHVWLNLYGKNVGYVDVEHPRWETPSKPYAGTDYIEMKHELGNAIWSLYIDTKDYYENLIGVYEDELSNLMDPISSSTSNSSTTTASGNNETRFNDTPQNTLASGTYADDNYATNVTKANSGSSVGVIGSSTTENDGMSKMARIDEVQRMLRNLYGDWAFEFNKLIVGE